AVELAEWLNLPTHEAPLSAFHCFPRQHPLFQGLFAARHTSGEKKGQGKGFDVVLNVGDYDLGDFDAGANVRPVAELPLFERGTKVARFALNPASIGRTTGFDLAFLANVRLTLQALLAEVKKARPERAYKGPRRRPVELAGERRGLSPLHP